MSKNNKNQPLTPREAMKRQLRKLGRSMNKNGGKPRATALYVVACIWMLTAIINFLIGYSTVAAVFVGIGVLTLVFAAYADWRESRRKSMDKQNSKHDK